MKNVTIKSRNFTILFIIAILFVSTTAVFSGVSVHKDSLNKETNDYLSFYEEEDGETIHWEVNFNAGEVVSIYKNGKKIPHDEITDYKWKVNHQLDEMRFGSEDFSFQVPIPLGDEFDIDMDQFHKDMERFREEMKENWKLPDDFGFDKEKFREEMEELHEKLDELRPEELSVPFDLEEFKEKMKELEKELREHKFDYRYFHFDHDESDKKTEEI